MISVLLALGLAVLIIGVFWYLIEQVGLPPPFPVLLKAILILILCIILWNVAAPFIEPSFHGNLLR